jgi:tetratricopeptide (TPR) repeat protein
MQRRLYWILLGLMAAAVIFLLARPRQEGDQFSRLMAVGAGYLEKGDAAKAITAYSQAAELVPESLDAHLNLANAYLLAGNNPAALLECQQALGLDHNSPAAYFLQGCAFLHLNQAEPAVQSFQQSQKIDPAVTALNFQLGLAQERLGHLEDSIHEFETVVHFEPGHPSAHYQLSRLYQRVSREAEAAQELEKHQQILAKNPNPPRGSGGFERCKYTQPRVAFVLDQPQPQGIAVRFSDATATAFGPQASNYRGPLGVLDYNHDGRNSLFVVQESGFRLLNNSKGQFAPLGEPLPATPGADYRRCLVGDLDNDHLEDVVVLGEQASHVFRFATNGQFLDTTVAAGLQGLKARDGLLADLDFTGKLDLLTVLPGGQGLRVYQNLQSFYFQPDSTNSGLPQALAGSEHVAVADWNNEDVPGLIVSRAGQAPVFFSKQRAGSFVQTNLSASWPAGTVLTVGDLNNDLRPDLVVATDSNLEILFGGTQEKLILPLAGLHPTGLLLIDYDNDGWLDLLAYGNGIRLWRNLGRKGFTDMTASVGLDKVGSVDSLVAADFDEDGDTDLVMSSAAGLRFWRNEGANANKQLKLRLAGNRSNASGLGVRVELISGRWHATRTLEHLPFEIGVGKAQKIDVLRTHWFDLTTTMVETPVQAQPLELIELTVPSGSCPYLYAWDGRRFRFVTDILGASPLGLPLNETRYIEADPEEYLALGNPAQFPPKDRNYEVRITEELREVLYLDEAKLVVADHPAGTRVLPTSMMHPAKPFPAHALRTVRPLARLQRATRSDGLDVTLALAETDGQMVSPVRLRQPQLRGLAEPFSVTMDFGPLPADRPLVLVLNGWLRFGGGMANAAAARDSHLPFPFPSLEAELADGSWKPVQADAGAPAGKTKTIVVDLEQKLPPGARRLRLTTAFEIHWDSAELCEKVSSNETRVTQVTAGQTDLHWRGFSPFASLPDSLPLTPQYDQVQSTPPWSRTPAGWCTRYGPVDELVSAKDNALVLLNGGDELALSFPADRLPPEPAGSVRDFFLYVVGWDKDADYHVGQGWQVEPLPFLGMDDQAYGRQPRPVGLNDSWLAKYNTRWVGPLVLKAASH